MKALITFICMVFLCPVFTANSQEKWTLQRCIAYGREHSMAAREQSILNKLPVIDKKTLNGSYLPQANIFSGNYYNNGNFPGYFQHSWGINASMAIYCGNRKQYELKKANLVIMQGDYALAATQNDVEFNTLYAYIEVLVTRQRYSCYKEYQRKLLVFSERKVSNCSSSKLLLLSQMKRDSLEAQSLFLQYEIAVIRLKQIINLDEATEFEIVPIADFMPVYTKKSQALEKAIQADPSISTNYLDIKIAGYDIAIAKSYSYPQLSYIHNSTYNTSNNKVLGLDGPQYYSGLSITIPLFNGNKQKLTVQRTVVQQEYQKKRLENQLQSMENSITMILTELKNREIRLDSFKTMQVNAAKEFEEAEREFKNCNISQEAYITIRGLNLRYDLDYINAYYDMIAQKKLLDFYTGVSL